MTEPPPTESSRRSGPRRQSGRPHETIVGRLDLDIVVDDDVDAGRAQGGEGIGDVL